MEDILVLVQMVNRPINTLFYPASKSIRLTYRKWLN